MSGRAFAAGALLAALVPLATIAGAGPGRAAETAAPAAATFTCAECGMLAEAGGRFTAQLTVGADTLQFCDIGDLAAYVGRTRPKAFAATVRDFPSGESIDAAGASYVIDKKTYATPMGWGVAAFRDRAAATGAPLGWDALVKALR